LIAAFGSRGAGIHHNDRDLYYNAILRREDDMHHTDIAIAGGGLAGSTAAAMLAAAGFEVVLIDPHPTYPPDFRCEKLDSSQVRILHRTGLADRVLQAATFDGTSSVARFGRLLDTRPGDQHGIFYDVLVNTIRDQIPQQVSRICAKVSDIALSSDRQTVKLSNGDSFSARLVVVANGLNSGLRHKLGMTQQILSPCHSVMLGFDLVPRGRAKFDFCALTYYSERPTDKTAYITLFPIGSNMRANLSVYRDMKDPWLRDFREAPQQTLFASLPGLRRLLGDFDVPDFVKIRPADLYLTGGHRRAGAVLVGDAFATSCPAAGTGTGKVFTDVERLCNVYVPQWFATAGMGVEKISAFYNDPVKQACDAHSLAKAYHLRSLSIETGMGWRVRRSARFASRLAAGMFRQASSWRQTKRPVVAYGAVKDTRLVG
jgi:2-polyprenyl-6-methoxyphenol hydroxylase-like FAD-dependent oxidoreductase